MDGNEYKNLQEAFDASKNGSRIELGEGVYQQAGVLSADDVTIIGKGKVKFHSASAWGKGAFVIRGANTRIENIECFDISVPSNNGACVRLDGRNLELINTYFHDAQQGVLTGPSPGRVFIQNSRFERLGMNGRAHGIYIGGGELFIIDSHFLSSKSEGHEIKSRASETIIENTVIASLDGNDSRLVDISNGGRLKITNSVLQQGPNTSNWDMIGYGLEGYIYQDNEVILTGNIFLMERENGSNPLHIKGEKVTPIVSQNAFVGKGTLEESSDNFYFPTREDAGLSPYPFLPETK